MVAYGFLNILLGEEMQGSLSCCLGEIPEGNNMAGRAARGGMRGATNRTELCAAWHQAPVGVAKQGLLCLHFCYFVN